MVCAAFYQNKFVFLHFQTVYIEEKNIFIDKKRERESLKKKMNTTTSKPTSLLALFPEKEPIIFDVNLCGAPPEIENLLQHTKVIAEQFLYRWKTFPISKFYKKSIINIARKLLIKQYFSFYCFFSDSQTIVYNCSCKNNTATG